MALQKQSIDIAFGKGIDTKSDPFRVPLGTFLSLQNAVFDTQGLLKKRSGYAQLASVPSTKYTYSTTFSGNLTAIGNNLAAYSSGSNTWIEKGSFQPVKLDTLALIRSNTNQSTSDSAIASNGLVCTVYTDQDPSNLSSSIYRYAVADSVTGQNIVVPTSITAGGAPRVLALDNYFVIVYPNSGTLLFTTININTFVVTAPVTITSLYTAGRPFDCTVINNAVYVAWAYNTTPSIKINYIDSTLTVHSAVSFDTFNATTISITADNSTPAPTVWVSFYNTGTTTGYSLAVNLAMATILAPTQIIASGTVTNITSTATGNVCTVYYQVTNLYAYSATLRSDYIIKNTMTAAGVLGSPVTLLRSVGLASKAFFIGTTAYFLCVYGSGSTTDGGKAQPTYFLSDSSGNISLKLAYGNGGGYVTVLPGVSVSGTKAYVSYLIKDLIIPVNKTVNSTAAALYTQTGINLATIEITASDLVTSEIASDLHITGGFLWMYDGYKPVEHGFHLYPEDTFIVGSSTSGSMTAQAYSYVATYEWTDNQGNLFRSAPSIPLAYTIIDSPPTFTATTVDTTPTLSVISAFTGLQVGQHITGTGIPVNTHILSIGATTITMDKNATASNSGVTITPASITSVTVDVPTLRLTYKTLNPVKIVLYRWAANQTTFYQVTSISTPTLNSTTVDYVSISDIYSSAQIIGNSILYTTGGVIENIGAPATSGVALFKSRLFLIDAEDKNLLWYSKQVIEATPVEMSDLFTIYVAPTVSSEGSTGPMRALAALDDKLIIFKENAIYYITGTGPDNTGTNNDFSDPVFITSTVGCANPNSIVFVPTGLMFQSNKGIWLLGRDLSTQYIGSPVEAYNGNLVLSAVAPPGTNQVRFTLNNGLTLMYDYFYGQWGIFTNIPAITSTLFQNLHTYVDSIGRVFQENPGSYIDGASPVLMSFATAWINVAGFQGYQRAYFLYLLGTYISPHKLNVQVAYDYNPVPLQTTIISPTNFSGTYGVDPTYGALSPYGGQSTLEQWRIFLQKQTCQSLQISVSESFDPFYGTAAGAGLTLSGINATIGVKKSYRPIRAANSAG